MLHRRIPVNVKRPLETRYDQQNVQPFYKSSFNCAVHGFISYYGQGILTNIGTNMDSLNYCNEILFPTFEWLDDHCDFHWMWHHDNSSVHACDYTMDFLMRNRKWPYQIIEWPAKSLDLNIIENLWAVINRRKRQTMREEKITSKNQLFSIASQVWNNVPMEYIQNLYASIPRRIKAVIDDNSSRSSKLGRA